MLKYSTENGYTREELEELQKKNVCSVCGENLVFFRRSIKDSTEFLACRDWPKTQHGGIAREYKPPREDYQTNIRRLKLKCQMNQ